MHIIIKHNISLAFFQACQLQKEQFKG